MRRMSLAARHATRVAAALAATTTAVAAQSSPDGVATSGQASSAWAAASPLRPTQLFVQASHAPTASGAGIGAGWAWRWQRTLGDYGVLAARTDAILEHWWITRRSDAGGGSATRLGITPVLQWRRARDAGLFVEVGLGLNWIGPTYTTGEKRFGSVFNFGEHIGVGWRGAGALPWEWTLRYQHFSNGGLSEPNPGENFVQLRVAKGF